MSPTDPKVLQSSIVAIRKRRMDKKLQGHDYSGEDRELAKLTTAYNKSTGNAVNPPVDYLG